MLTCVRLLVTGKQEDMAQGRSGKNRDDVLLRSAEFIGWALGGLEHEIARTKERLTALNAQAAKLRARARAKGAVAARAAAAAFNEPAVRVKRSYISKEGRKRISEMMKKRWAERRKKTAAKG
jgi:hypothetical protein